MADTQIREPIPDHTPPPPGAPTAAPQTLASAISEYLAAGTFSPALGDYFKSLPKYVDEIERDIGADTYERMLTDPQVFSDVSILKQAVIAQEMQINPAVKEEDPDYAAALEYKEFCERCVARLPSFRTGFLYEMLDAIPFGHRLAEQVFEIAATGEDVGRIVPKALKIKPRISYAFVVDSFQNVVGILGIIPGRYWSSLSGILSYNAEELAKLPNLLPRSKFAVLTLLEKASDIRGTSWLRPAYNSWFLKVRILPEFWRYLTQFASPSLVGTLPPDSQPTVQLDAGGTPITDDSGNAVTIDPSKSLLSLLLAYHTGSALVVPHGTTVQSLFTYTTGEAYRFAIDLLNHEINQGMLFQSLATMEAQFGSRAASQTHQDILELPIQYVRTSVEEMVRRDLFQLWIRLNYGEDAVRLTPTCNLGDTAQQNFNQKAMAMARLEASGFIDPSQYRGIDEELGLPVRTQDEVDARTEMKKAAAQAIQTANAQPAAAPGTVKPVVNEVMPVKEQGADVRA